MKCGNKTVQKYTDDFIEKAMQIEDVTEADLLHDYLRGLLTDIRLAVKRRGVTGLEAVMTVADEEDQLIRGERADRGGHAELGITPKYIPGRANIVADALSRNPPTTRQLVPSSAKVFRMGRAQRLPVCPRPLPEAVPVSVQPVGSSGAEYADLPDLVPQIEESQTPVREGDGQQSRIGMELQSLTVSATQSQAFLDACRRGYSANPFFHPGTVMAGVHSPPHAAHFRMGKTYRKVASLYYWPKMWKSVASFVCACDRCQRSKGPTVARPGLLQPLPIPSCPWETCIDRLTDLPPSGDEGFNAILVVLCRLIKAVVLIPTHSTAGTEETAQIYRQHVSCKKGFQRHIVCDRDPRFVARFWQTLHASSGSEVNFATAWHHDIAGAAERMNRTLEEALRCLVDTKHSRWSEFLCDVEFAYNSSVHEGTGFAPLTLDGGKFPLIPPALNLPVSVEPSFDAREFLEEHSQMIAAARDSLRSAQQVMTQNANRRRRPAENIRIGDYVLVHCTWWPRPVGKGEEYARKLDSVWFGPFEVETALPRDNLEVVLPTGSRKHPIIHTSLCKPYRQPSGETRPPSVRMPA
uniref:Integrase catalytic domain-containing protein n=1 Tax=Chromera velia CCMP2878 TaxID=1169474 RepID=A0A0G4HAN2_9ALVE|eukprot:Cvel_25586.t1-p1 / transcript=Cvel_25586.t1 / gene=Cvel_25586 / organism=Chromera_velia_CCMP2878 / gene_product=Transposon Ty3-I Gag-Pol polyprotein, putative / transcript_product=Transposon Ty3-I Gag-Pol polyprotein, putative / location=Cvel_scaffold2919:3488-6080(+) / protein_length=579 / sequence_SO=supercontig / SO=protein_coding / is_pseudo=false